MITKERIEFYKEVLAAEPTSKLFYPLARIYAEAGELEKSCDTLRQGLRSHPDHMEARLLLVDVLTRSGHEGEAVGEVDELGKKLCDHPAFWRLWSQKAPGGSPDVALALRFVASCVEGREFTWAEVISAGIDTLSGKGFAESAEEFSFEPATQTANEPAGGDAASAPIELRDEVESAAASVADEGGDVDEVTTDDPATAPTSSSAKDALQTRTMAELLARQGDLQGALAILRALVQRTTSDEAREELTAHMHMLEEQGVTGGTGQASTSREAEGEFPLDRAKKKLVNALSLLADRLEARAGA